MEECLMREGNSIYEVEPWSIRESSFDPAHNRRGETIFTVANGYLGMRGHFEEGLEGAGINALNGTYLNGFYDSADITYGEEAFGYARKRQTMLNVTDSKIIELFIDGEQFNLLSGRVIEYERILDMQKGILSRHVVWESGTGKQVEVNTQRLISFDNKHVAMVRYTVKPVNFTGEIKLVSALNGKVTNEISADDPRAGSAFGGQVLHTVQSYEENTFMALEQRTTETEFHLLCGAEHTLDYEYTLSTIKEDERMAKAFTMQVDEGQSVTLDKSIVYYSSKDYEVDHLLILAQSTLKEVKAKGWDALTIKQKEYLDEFWEVADVNVEGDELLQQGLRYNAYQLFQSVGRDGKTNISAKGITGEGYEGHYFWDTETYMLPFFLYTKPELALRLLEYRYYTLPKARERAVEMAAEGALFPWRTINGEEASAYYPGGTAQFHINADVAHAIIQYVEATGDQDFLQTKGLEMLIEISRFFLSVGNWITGKGFCINGVTGPDEYTAIVNNNTYTNIMVKDALEFTVHELKQWEELTPDSYLALHSLMGLTEEELADWSRAADEIYIHRQNGLIGQDDSFLDKGVWDFDNTPAENYPLLLHYHPLVIYRQQVIKQADLILAFYLLGEKFTKLEKVKNYAYYEPLTTHDSSLSAAIHAIIAAELGNMDHAYNFFIESARMDLDDIHGNVKDGIHAASMAGSWLTIIGGFAGMRQYDGRLHFEPKLPPSWTEYSFRVQFQDRLINVNVEGNKTTYSIVRGEPLTIEHYGQEYIIAMTQPLEANNRDLCAIVFGLEGVVTSVIDEEADAEQKAELLPGVEDLLQHFADHNIAVVLASDRHDAEEVVEQLGIRQHFNRIITANDVDYGKPDPEIFIKAANAVNIHPYHTMVIEDSTESIQSARQIGMKTIAVSSQSRIDSAHFTVPGLDGLNLETMIRWMQLP